MPEYRIKIGTSIGSRLTGTVTHAQFPKCKADDAGDKFSFQSSCIIIECKRSNIQKKEEIENNPGNTLRVQIMRALLLYYAANIQKARVNSISVTRINKHNKVLITELTFSVKTQPLILRAVPAHFQFNMANLVQNVLGPNSHVFETILSHWLGAWTVSDRYDIFARVWRCLEQLSVKAYHGARVIEKNCLEALRTFIRGHASEIPLSCNHVDAMTYDELRAFSWKLLIYNNFKRTGSRDKYLEYRDLFVLPYHDERVLRMLQATLVYRNGELNTHGFLNDINNHLTAAFATPVKRNEDIVAILCGYYAYYTRNKIFHGEFSERSFNICRSREDDIIDKLNGLMYKLTFELIEAYQLL